MSITLKSNDNKTFSLPENACKKSAYLEKLIKEENSYFIFKINSIY